MGALRVEDARDYRYKPGVGAYFPSGKDEIRKQERQRSKSSVAKRRTRAAAQLEEHLRSLADAYEQDEDAFVEVREVTQEEVIEEISRDVRARLGMTLEEFGDAYRKGTLPDTLAVNELVITLRFAGLA